VFGAGLVLAPDQKSSWNSCQQANKFLSLKTLQRNLTLEREISKVKISESIRGTKEVQENLTFVYDSVKKKNVVKEEVLECQLVTTS